MISQKEVFIYNIVSINELDDSNVFGCVCGLCERDVTHCLMVHSKEEFYGFFFFFF